MLVLWAVMDSFKAILSIAMSGRQVGKVLPKYDSPHPEKIQGEDILKIWFAVGTIWLPVRRCGKKEEEQIRFQALAKRN